MAVPTIGGSRWDVLTSSPTDVTSSFGTTEDDDIIIAIVSLDGTAGAPAITGFTSVGTIDEGSVEGTVFWKRVTDAASEPADYTVSYTGNEAGLVRQFRIKGAITSGSPIDQTGSTSSGTASSVALTAITSAVADTLAFAFVAVDRDRVGAGDTVSGTGWSLYSANSSGGANGAGLMVATKSLPSAGGSGSPTFDWGTSDGYGGFVFNIKPTTGTLQLSGTATGSSSVKGTFTADVPTNNVVGYWTCNSKLDDETTNANDFDNNGNGYVAAHFNNGIERLSSATTKTSAGDAAVHTFGDGSTDSDFSISFIYKRTSGTDSSVILGKRDGFTREWFVDHASNDSIQFVLEDESGGWQLTWITGADTVTNNDVFHHIVITYDASASRTDRAKIYIDGAQIGNTFTDNVSYVAMENTSAPFHLSSVSPNGMGQIVQCVGIWDKALTAEEAGGVFVTEYQRKEYLNISTVLALSGTATGSSSVTGDIETTEQLAGTADGSSSVTGDATIRMSLAGQLDGSSSVSGAIKTTYALSGQSDGVSTVTGDIVVTENLAGQTDGISSVTGDAKITASLSGQLDGNSDVSGDVIVTEQLSGQSDGVTTVSGDLRLSKPLAGQTDGVSSVSGQITVTKALSGQSDGVSTVSGVIETTEQLSGQTDGVATVSGAATTKESLVGQLDASSSVNGNLTIAGSTVQVSGQADGVSTVSGDIDTTEQLSGQTDGVSAVSGNATLRMALAGQGDGVSTVTGETISTATLSGQIDGSSSVSGGLDIAGSTASITGTITGSSSVTGDIFGRAYLFGLAGQDFTTSSGRAGDAGLKQWIWKEIEFPPFDSGTGTSFGPNNDLEYAVECDTKSVTRTGGWVDFHLNPTTPPTSTNGGCSRDYNMRAEMYINPWPIQHPLGTEEWIGFYYHFNSDYIIDVNEWLFHQVHNGVGGQTPLYELMIARSGLYGASAGEIVVKNNANSQQVLTGVIPQAGDTVKVVVHVIWDDASNGLLQVWLDDALVYDHQVTTIRAGWDYGGNAKFGIYKWPWADVAGVNSSSSNGVDYMNTRMGDLRMYLRTSTDPNNGDDAYHLVDPAQSNVGTDITGDLTFPVDALAGQADGSSDVSGTLSIKSVTKQLSGTADGVSTVTGDLKVTMSLSGQADGGSSVAADAKILAQLIGQGDGSSTISGDLTILSNTQDLAGQTDGMSSVVGDLLVNAKLSGQADGASSLSGNLSIFNEVLTGKIIKGHAHGRHRPKTKETIKKTFQGNGGGRKVFK